MTVAIVSTSINKEPVAYEAWAKQGDLIVAGDKNAPPRLAEYVKELGGYYITPEEQDLSPWSAALPWNCIQRRNAAVMMAYELGYQYVATVDDDNFPTYDWVDRHVGHIENVFTGTTLLATGKFPKYPHDGAWVDTGRFNTPPTRQRGTPPGVMTHCDYSFNPSYWPDVVVSTAQVLGAPDCDAVTRNTVNPTVESVAHSVIVNRDQWAAFNSQATMWRGDWAPMICCLPYVGRYDDIFASFLAKRVMMANGVSFYVGEPAVTQRRNPHDFLNDLREEVYGMEQTPAFISLLSDARVSPSDSLVNQYNAARTAVKDQLPPRTNMFLDKWIQCWRKIETGRAHG